MLNYEYIEIDEVVYKILKATFYKGMEIAILLEEGGEDDGEGEISGVDNRRRAH